MNFPWITPSSLRILRKCKVYAWMRFVRTLLKHIWGVKCSWKVSETWWQCHHHQQNKDNSPPCLQFTARVRSCCIFSKSKQGLWIWWTRLVLDFFLGEMVFLQLPLLSDLAPASVSPVSSLLRSPRELLWLGLFERRGAGEGAGDRGPCWPLEWGNPNTPGPGGERDRRGLWTSTGGEVENWTGRPVSASSPDTGVSQL